MKTVVEVDGVHVGWFEDDTFYPGQTYDLGHPSAMVNEAGEVIDNRFGNHSLGWIEPSGEVRAGTQYSDTPAGSVTTSGEICNADGQVVGIASGPNAKEAGASWLLLELSAANRDARRGFAAGASAAAAWITTEEPTTQAESVETADEVDDALGFRGRDTRAPSPLPFDPRTDWQPGDPWPNQYTPVAKPASSLPKFIRRRLGRIAIGDLVDVNRFGGRGQHVVLEISKTTSRGGGTKLFPAFLCESLQDGVRDWFGYGSLTLV